MTQTQEQKDIAIIKHEVENINHHFKVYKSDVTDMNKSLDEIKLLLGGSQLNGYKGFIYVSDELAARVKILETENQQNKSDLRHVKFWGRTATAIFIAIIVAIVHYIKDKL